MDFRIATDADVDALVALIHSGYRGDSSRRGWTTEADLLEGQRTDAEEVRSIISSNYARIVIAEENGELAGCIKVEFRENSVGYLGMFAVRPEMQGRGIGRALIDEAERRARVEHGANVMEMDVIEQRPELIAWYERLGYVRTGESAPFPYGDERFGLPQRDDLRFVILQKPL